MLGKVGSCQWAELVRLKKPLYVFLISQNVSGSFRCWHCSSVDHQVMLKASLMVPREKLLKKLQCSNGKGGPEESAVGSSMEEGEEGLFL